MTEWVHNHFGSHMVRHVVARRLPDNTHYEGGRLITLCGKYYGLKSMDKSNTWIKPCRKCTNGLPAVTGILLLPQWMQNKCGGSKVAHLLVQHDTTTTKTSGGVVLTACGWSCLLRCRQAPDADARYCTQCEDSPLNTEAAR